MYAGIVNLRSSSHPHFKSVLEEGLWGFPDNRINRVRWSLLKPGVDLLLYFEHMNIRGVWIIAEVLDVRESRDPVRYWVENPVGYPLQITLKIKYPREHKPSPTKPFKIEWLDSVKPIARDELAYTFGVRAFRAFRDRWSLYIFGDVRERGVTYNISVFEKILNEYILRNKAPIRRSPTHRELVEIIYNMGQLQGKYPAREEAIDGGRIDVVWRKIPRSDASPYIAFEIHVSGDLHADLVKLKHAYDIWNSIPVLVLPKAKKKQAKKWIEGSFHEIAHAFKIITIEEIIEFYQKKRELKDMERKLGII